jgi:tryptophan-rich sensory protein
MSGIRTHNFSSDRHPITIQSHYNGPTKQNRNYRYVLNLVYNICTSSLYCQMHSPKLGVVLNVTHVIVLICINYSQPKATVKFVKYIFSVI